MRDPKRIDMILKELEYYWKKNPDLRLGQIISNMGSFANAPDIFYMEDEKMFCFLRLSNCGFAKVGEPDNFKYVVSMTGQQHMFDSEEEAVSFVCKMIPIVKPESIKKLFCDIELQPTPKEDDNA